MIEISVDEVEVNDPEDGQSLCDIEPEKPFHQLRLPFVARSKKQESGQSRLIGWPIAKCQLPISQRLAPKVNGWKPDDAVLVFQTMLAVCL